MRYVLALAIALPATTGLAQITFSGLGRPPGADTSLMSAVSADGRVALGTIFAPTPPDTWVMRWTFEGGAERLVEPPNLRSPGASGISADGSVITGSGSLSGGGGFTGFRWTREEGYVLLPGYPVNALSDDARVLVGNQNLYGRPFRWSESSGYQFVGDTGQAYGTAADGSVIIGAAAEGLPGGGWRWTEATGQVSIGTLPAGWDVNRPWDISPDGSVIVGHLHSSGAPAGDRTYRWTIDDGFQLLPALPDATSTYAEGVAADGRTIVGSARFGNPEHAVIWTPDGEVHDLGLYLESLGANLGGWRLLAATSISDDALTIVGNGLNPDGIAEGWIVRVPAPGSGVVLLLLACTCFKSRVRFQW